MVSFILTTADVERLQAEAAAGNAESQEAYQHFLNDVNAKAAQQANLIQGAGPAPTVIGEPVQSSGGSLTQGAKVTFGETTKRFVADTGTADTEFAVPHDLGRIPTHVQILPAETLTVGGNLYASGTAWTETTIYLKYSGSNAAVWVGFL